MFKINDLVETSSGQRLYIIQNDGDIVLLGFLTPSNEAIVLQKGYSLSEWATPVYSLHVSHLKLIKKAENNTFTS